MLRRFKTWLYKRFLPRETKEIYLRDMQNLLDSNKALKAENERLSAYIRGMEYACRRNTRIEIHNNSEDKA